MSKPRKFTPDPKPRRRPNYIRQWRKHRGLTLEQLAERVGTTHATVSRVERGLQDYTGEFLEAAAYALMCEPVDLLTRDPTDPDAIWSIWERALPAERQQIVLMSDALLKARRTGSD
jgi:transcriptional regulator with XRE-family HTH domain